MSVVKTVPTDWYKSRSKHKDSWTTKVKENAEKCVSLKGIFIFIASVGVVWLIYEGARYLLQDYINLPGFIGYSQGFSMSQKYTYQVHVRY